LIFEFGDAARQIPPRPMSDFVHHVLRFGKEWPGQKQVEASTTTISGTP